MEIWRGVNSVCDLGLAHAPFRGSYSLFFNKIKNNIV